MTSTNNNSPEPTPVSASDNSPKSTPTDKPEIIFFGNGPLADYALNILEKSCDIIFHARSKEDLETVKKLKTEHPAAHGILASFGVIIKSDVLDLFEPEGILNIHPSLLPKYRGPSPIESAILNGDTTFGVSVMKLVKAMDAGPIYHQESFDFSLTTPKDEIYRTLSEAAATWLANALKKTSNATPGSTLAPSSTTSDSTPVSPSILPLFNIVSPTIQDDTEATYTEKLDKSLSPLDPTKKSAGELLNQIRAFAGFPKSKYTFFDLDCTIISAHVATPDEVAEISTPDEAAQISTSDVPNNFGYTTTKTPLLYLCCSNNSLLIIDELQPAGRKIMDVKSFLNGYKK